MRKLTKTINKRRKNYKATIGLTTETGKRVSFNATVFYIEKERAAKAEAEREAKRLVRNFIRQQMPTLAAVMDYFGMAGGAYYW